MVPSSLAKVTKKSVREYLLNLLERLSYNVSILVRFFKVMSLMVIFVPFGSSV